jgi:hypothetical protein
MKRTNQVEKSGAGIFWILSATGQTSWFYADLLIPGSIHAGLGGRHEQAVDYNDSTD